MKLKPAALLALLAVAPFTVGFTPPPEGPGTTVSVSGGTGRFLAPSGCSRPHVIKYTDQQAGAYHAWHLHKGVETNLGVGADVHAFQSREKECVSENCGDLDSGFTRNGPLFAVSAYGTADWRWVGLTLGAIVATHERRGGSAEYDIVSAWIPEGAFPMGSLRLGTLDLLYATLDLGTGRPYKSGGGSLYGVGGRLLGTDLWVGAEEWVISSGMSASVARRFGDFRVRLAGSLGRGQDSDGMDADDPTDDFRVDLPEHSLSVGLDYSLPW